MRLRLYLAMRGSAEQFRIECRVTKATVAGLVLLLMVVLMLMVVMMMMMDGSRQNGS